MGVPFLGAGKYATGNNIYAMTLVNGKEFIKVRPGVDNMTTVEGIYLTNTNYRVADLPMSVIFTPLTAIVPQTINNYNNTYNDDKINITNTTPVQLPNVNIEIKLPVLFPTSLFSGYRLNEIKKDTDVFNKNYSNNVTLWDLNPDAKYAFDGVFSDSQLNEIQPISTTMQNIYMTSDMIVDYTKASHKIYNLIHKYISNVVVNATSNIAPYFGKDKIDNLNAEILPFLPIRKSPVTAVDVSPKLISFKYYNTHIFATNSHIYITYIQSLRFNIYNDCKFSNQYATRSGLVYPVILKISSSTYLSYHPSPISDYVKTFAHSTFNLFALQMPMIAKYEIIYSQTPTLKLVKCSAIGLTPYYKRAADNVMLGSKDISKVAFSSNAFDYQFTLESKTLTTGGYKNKHKHPLNLPISIPYPHYTINEIDDRLNYLLSSVKMDDVLATVILSNSKSAFHKTQGLYLALFNVTDDIPDNYTNYILLETLPFNNVTGIELTRYDGILYLAVSVYSGESYVAKIIINSFTTGTDPDVSVSIFKQLAGKPKISIRGIEKGVMV